MGGSWQSSAKYSAPAPGRQPTLGRVPRGCHTPCHPLQMQCAPLHIGDRGRGLTGTCPEWALLMHPRQGSGLCSDSDRAGRQPRRETRSFSRLLTQRRPSTLPPPSWWAPRSRHWVCGSMCPVAGVAALALAILGSCWGWSLNSRGSSGRPGELAGGPVCLSPPAPAGAGEAATPPCRDVLAAAQRPQQG